MTDPPYSSEALEDCGQSLVLLLITLTPEVWALYLLLSLSYLQMWWLILLASSTGPWGHARADKPPGLSGMTHRKCGQYHPMGWGPGLDISRAELSASVPLPGPHCGSNLSSCFMLCHHDFLPRGTVLSPGEPSGCFLQVFCYSNRESNQHSVLATHPSLFLMAA